MYGKHWLDMWAGQAMDEVKTVWAEDLAFASVGALRSALAHCQHKSKFPPTLPEFVSLCRDFRDTGRPNLRLASPRQQAPAEAIQSLRAILRKAGHKA